MAGGNGNPWPGNFWSSFQGGGNFPFDRRGKIPSLHAVNLLLNGILLRPLLLGLASR